MRKKIVFSITVLSTMFLLSACSSSGYFKDAEGKSSGFKVTGRFDKTKPLLHDSLSTKQQWSFYMIDEKGDERKVVMTGRFKPQGLDSAAYVTVTGVMQGNEFHASQLTSLAGYTVDSPSRGVKNNSK
ncbi:hypothetical protein [Mucilaginibacter lacusdianchii]|uniref:hypothetical protein n=1 Tax=Mucilaginibacter lacusdianchii TaxID=2684211 RepID=UPI00131BEC10|nr:hypothetical protein [Mucilaginibacter sp. JXJ CY 39]